MKLYLDLCTLKRPFDDRSHERVDLEARATLRLLRFIADGEHELVWSSALTFENEADPDHEVLEVVEECSTLARQHVQLSNEVLARIEQLTNAGLKPLDAAHLALAEAAACEALVTCDDSFEKRAQRISSCVRVVNPVELLAEL